MRTDGSFRLVTADHRRAGQARALAAFFDQFERASTRLIPILSQQDHDDIERHAGRIERLTPIPGMWDGSPLMGYRDPHDGRGHAREFAARMRAEKERGPLAALEFAARMREERLRALHPGPRPE